MFMDDFWGHSLQSFKAGLSSIDVCYPVPGWLLGSPGGSVVKNPPANAGDPGSIPGSGRSTGEGNGNPLQYPCLKNPMDRGAWRATVNGLTMSQTRLSNFTFTFSIISNTFSLKLLPTLFSFSLILLI